MMNPYRPPSLRVLFTTALVLTTVSLWPMCWLPSAFAKPLSLVKGKPIPSVLVIGKQGEEVSLDRLKGKVTVISVVPQLNTPVCDEQTHRFSEGNGGLDQSITFVTMSTNTHTDQQVFATKANIHNMLFLSDAPDFHFGTHTGLLLKELGILHRAVLVLDAQGIIRYIELVPLGQLPNIDQALRVARTQLANTSQGVTHD